MISGYLLIFVYALIVLWVFSFIFLYRKQITCMAGMMIAMTLGMSLGLALGTIFGILNPDHFFQITVISILIGGIIGVIAGLPFSIMAVLDGFLSGAMGGMMGAMLGVMLAIELINIVINVFVVLTGGILFILFLMIQSEVKFKEKGWKNTFFANRLPLFLIVVFSFYITHNYTFVANIDENDQHQHSDYETTEEKDNEIHHDH